MTNTVIFTEGFDKYGPAATSATAALNAIAGSQMGQAMKGIWSIAGLAANHFIGPPCVGAGSGSYTIVGGANNANAITSTLAATQAKAVGGIYIRVNTIRSSNTGDLRVLIFRDGATVQASIGIDTTGHIIVANAAGTTIATSTGTVTAGTAFLLEWDFQMTNSATWTVWKDGSVLLSGTAANFHGSANNFYNQIVIQCIGSATQASHDISFDHMYVNDGSSTALLSQTVIETDFPTSDSAVQFAPGSFGIGYQNCLGTGQSAPGANSLYLRKITAPAGGCTLNSIALFPEAASATANVKAVLSADSAGVPGALIATGTQVTGIVANALATFPFASGQVLTAATSYWIGYITDTSVLMYQSDTTLNSYQKNNTYSGGAPNPAGTATSSVFAGIILFGICTGTTANWLETAGQVSFGAYGDFSYVFDSTVGHEDLFGIGALSITPSAIFAANVFAFLKDSVAGARTVTINLKSGSTDSGGTGFTPGTSYGWANNIYALDPNGSIAWTAANLNAATSGYKITA